jgi:hypothetical protein
MPGVKLRNMKFRHRTVYHLLGLQAIDADPWTLIDSVPIGSINDEYGRWLQKLGLDGLTVHAEITCREQIFDELDRRTAIANSMLNGTLEIGQTVDEQLEEIRLERSGRFGNTAWLVLDVDGEDTRSSNPTIALDDELGASTEVTNSISSLNELSSSRAAALHHYVAGAVMLAAGRATYIAAASKGCWHVRTDGAPHFRFALQASATSFASMPLRPQAATRLTEVLNLASSDPSVSRALVSLGQSLQWGLDPSLQFLSAFTALELYTKAGTKAPAWQATGKRTGLAKRFEKLAHADPADCDLFDRLYELRNDMAHRAQLNGSGAEQARELLSKYMK